MGSSLAGRLRTSTSDALVERVRIRSRLEPPADTVALTFDDGPDADYTVTILDELARLEIPATFFLVGEKARARPEMVRRMIAEGHAVGSHSCSHPDPWALGARALIGDYRQGRALVEAAAGREVRLFRPPKGFVNGKGALAMLRSRLRPWLWTIDPGDWQPDATADAIVAGCADLAAGDVVLLHDSINGPLAPSALDRSATAAALERIAGIARDRDLRFTKLV